MMMMNPNMMGMMNPAALMAQMPPEMIELSKKMHEQRQQLMQEFEAKGGKSNPAAVQELMTKAAQLQQTAFAELKSKMSSGALPMMPMMPMPMPPGSGGGGGEAVLPSTSTNLDLMDKETPANATAAGSFLGANMNMSKLDDLINKKQNTTKKMKEEEEKRILEAIARKDYAQLNAIKATQYGVIERLKELVESGQTDPNTPDSENVYLLHWAAINNRLDIAKYLINRTCKP
jgi:hypothetical protein